MRKLTIGALAALTAMAGVGIANAQDAPSPGAEVTVSVSPKDAGTRTRPKPTKVTLEIVNEDSSQTADRIRIYHPRQLRISGRGLVKCSQAKLATLDPDNCPAASRLGVGTADAVQDVNGSRNPLKFNLTAFMRTNSSIGFMIRNQDRSLPIDVLAIGTFKDASGQFGKVLDVPIPQLAREFPPGVYNGLKGLKTSLYKKRGSRALYKSTGCTSQRTLPFRADIRFQANPNPPKAPEIRASAAADCTK